MATRDAAFPAEVSFEGGVPPAGVQRSTSLRTRMAVLTTAALVIAVAGFSLLVGQMVARQQRATLEQVLERELSRVQRLVAESQVGDLLVTEAPGDLTLQFVTPDGVVRIPADGEAALPLAVQPSVDESVEPPRLVGSTEWILPSGASIGTIRIALDMGDVLAARAGLVRSFVVAGSIVVAVFLLIQVVLVQRVLAPLRRLEAAAREVDPADPEPIPHRGPADEVGQLAAALNQALAGIREYQQRERDMLTEVSHELGGPMSVVVGQLELLRDELEDDPRQELATDAHRAATDLLLTARDLITLGRGELEIHLMRERIDLADVARHVRDDYPEIRCDVESVYVDGDLRRLRQALRNLLRNATEMGDVDGVELTVRADGASAVVAVRDAGPTFDPDELVHVYDRHFRLGRGAVSGIGLAVVKAIVEQHGGSVEAEAAAEGGTRYRMRLPRAPDR